MKQTTVGVIGAGRIGRMHAENLTRLIPEAEVRAVSSPHLDEDWAKGLGIGMDFNCTTFSHPKASDDLTLSHKDKGIRDFWIEHTKRCRTIGAEMGKQLGTPCIHNIWVQDGSKDIPVDRYTHRAILKESLDEIYADKYPTDYLKDAIEAKLFGIGLEAGEGLGHQLPRS